MEHGRKAILVLVGFMLLSANGVPRTFAQDKQPIDKLIAVAKTKAEHNQIAAFFDSEARDAASKAELLRRMARAYSGVREEYARAIKPLPSHCDRIAKRFEDVAKDASALAAAHRKMADQAAQ